jgi:hypothetical protein
MHITGMWSATILDAQSSACLALVQEHTWSSTCIQVLGLLTLLDGFLNMCTILVDLLLHFVIVVCDIYMYSLS